MRYFKIEGIIETNHQDHYKNETIDKFNLKFIEFLEKFEAEFGGGIKEVNSDGDDI